MCRSPTLFVVADTGKGKRPRKGTIARSPGPGAAAARARSWGDVERLPRTVLGRTTVADVLVPGTV